MILSQMTLSPLQKVITVRGAFLVGDRGGMEDHHAWAHYTGGVIVEHMSGDKSNEKALASLRDVRWCSLSLERGKPENCIKPSMKNREGVMALLIKIHDAVGPEAIGAALNHMENAAMGHRINQVRYYRFSGFETALSKVVEDPEDRKKIDGLFP